MKIAFYMCALAIGMAAPVQAVELITNGNFSNGLNGWALALTPNGSAGIGFPAATTFDVTGSGATTAAQFQVGQVDFQNGVPAGILFGQSIFTDAGSLSFSMDFAAFNPNDNFNTQGGIFSVLLNGLVQDSFATGGIAPQTTLRGSLAFNSAVTAGTQSLQVQITRPFSPRIIQYITNVSAMNVSDINGAVPEPSTWTMLIAGFGLAGAMLRRRRDALKPALGA